MKELQIRIPDSGSWEAFRHQIPLLPFAEVSLEFAHALSKKLLHHGKAYPELMALGFWLRRANLKRMNTWFETDNLKLIRLARGMTFHIAPANVDTQFVYSWFLSLLVGNTNVLRLPSTDSDQLSILLDQIASVLSDPKFKAIASRNLLVSFGHEDDINRTLSSTCDVRVLWGGDSTILQFRNFPLSPSAKEICFIDKFSLAILDAEAVIFCKDLSKLTQQFYNDAFGFDQNACSSPRGVVWKGNSSTIKKAQVQFWRELSKLVKINSPEIPLYILMEKVVTQYKLVFEKDVSVPHTTSAYINRIWFDKIQEIHQIEHGGGGLFYEVGIQKLEELLPLLTRKIQTVSSYGIESKDFVILLQDPSCRGIDRIVPIGSALDFNHFWDGYDLLNELSRITTII